MPFPSVIHSGTKDVVALVFRDIRSLAEKMWSLEGRPDWSRPAVIQRAG